MFSEYEDYGRFFSSSLQTLPDFIKEANLFNICLSTKVVRQNLLFLHLAHCAKAMNHKAL